LKINSKQTGYLEPSIPTDLSKTKKGFNGRSKPLNLYTQQRRYYSTKRRVTRIKRKLATDKQPGEDFWRKVNSKDMSDNDNPFIIVNKFMKKYSVEAAKDHINLKLIASILSRHIPFDLSIEEFNIISNITPTLIELPVEDKDELVKLVGKYVRGGKTGVAGAYVFTNKTDGCCYVGSSISLANRLATGYLGPKLGNRKIDSAIRDGGLDSFTLDLYILPQELTEKRGNKFIPPQGDGRIKCFTLALEQILLLKFYPEYNVLKVAGSPAGLKRTPESMLPSILKSSKPLYLYDEVNKELIHTSNSQINMCKALGITERNVGKYIRESSFQKYTYFLNILFFFYSKIKKKDIYIFGFSSLYFFFRSFR
jgi:hypothetical protein